MRALPNQFRQMWPENYNNVTSHISLLSPYYIRYQPRTHLDYYRWQYIIIVLLSRKAQEWASNQLLGVEFVLVVTEYIMLGVCQSKNQISRMSSRGWTSNNT